MKRIASLAELRALVKEDWAAHNREILSPGFHSLLVYRFGVWVHDRDGISRRVLHLAYRSLAFLAANAYGIELPWQARIGRRLHLPHRGGIVIHQGARIGDDVLIRQNVTIGVVGHGRNDGAPAIGDRVSFGAGAVAFGPIEIGDDVLIGPNAVVREDVPPSSAVLPPRPEVRARRQPGAARVTEAGASDQPAYPEP